ncbi:MAG TPA: type II toxin-antitoxin system RelE/ParE family toxin [Mucilaginibacter sp.]|jgi:hypothetical protein|nr:type II toxin-antitoxin system RelE/ParE family toxin [Mucilaginibacter sp.]
MIDEDALMDLQEATDWYNGRAENLGSRFKKQVKRQIAGLKKNAIGFNIRYAKIHCLPVKKFPYIIHYSVDEAKSVVKILAIIHTSRDPDIWEKKTKTS